LRSPPKAGRLRGGVKNPEGTGYKTFSYLKSSSIFLVEVGLRAQNAI